MVNSNFARLPHAPEYVADVEDPLAPDFEIRVRDAAWITVAIVVSAAVVSGVAWLAVVAVQRWVLS